MHFLTNWCSMIRILFLSAIMLNVYLSFIIVFLLFFKVILLVFELASLHDRVIKISSSFEIM